MKKIAVAGLVVLLLSISILGACSPTSNISTDSINVAYAYSPSTVDITSYKMAAADWPIGENIYDNLWAWSADGEPIAEGGLASYTVSDDGKVFTFTLREGVTFHNGDPLTTADVVFSHDRFMENSVPYPRKMTYLEELEVVDDYTIRWIFSEPCPLFFTSPRLYIASKAYHESVGEEVFVNNPVGTGPYKFIEWKAGEYLDLVANEDYWGEQPEFKSARIYFVTEETTRVAMLQSGEVDVITNTPMNMVATLEDEGYTHTQIPTSPDLALQFQTKNPDSPWYDVRVRKAMAHAIDRESIVNDIYYGIPNYYPRWLSEDDPAYDPSLEVYDYDVEKAKSLMAEAGFADGFEMPLTYESNQAGIRELVDVIALYLKEINITVKPEGLSSADIYASKRAVSQDPAGEAVYLAGCAMSNQPNQTALGYWDSSTPTSLYTCAEIDALNKQIDVTVDTEARAELVRQGMKILYENVAQVTLFGSVNTYTSRPGIVCSPKKPSFSMLLLYDIRLD